MMTKFVNCILNLKQVTFLPQRNLCSLYHSENLQNYNKLALWGKKTWRCLSIVPLLDHQYLACSTLQSCGTISVKEKRKLGRILKTHNCGELTSADIGTSVILRGFLKYQRIGRFAVLLDCYGETQVIITQDTEVIKQSLKETPLGSYVEVHGLVNGRPTGQENKTMKTGMVEVMATSFNILNEVTTKLPFHDKTYHKSNENIRMEYRYLDLRSPKQQQFLRLRSQIGKKMRDFLQDDEGFIEITTPTLTSITPGGSQEFVVPTQFPGSYYSLAQSPQLYKQLTMVAGFDKYFQFANCYRNDDRKHDKQPEFMQVDLEMSDVTFDEILRLTEELILYSWPDNLPPLSAFPQMSYAQAMDWYGTDKPDTRFEWKIQNITKVCQDCGSNIIQDAVSDKTNTARAFVIPCGQKYVNKNVIKKWKEMSQETIYGLSGLSVLNVTSDDTLSGLLSNKLSSIFKKNLIDNLCARTEDTIIMAVGPDNSVLRFLGKLRLTAAEHVEACDGFVRNLEAMNFLWVIDFPLFEYNKELDKIVSVHHPFTRAKLGHQHLIYEQPLQATSQHYDLVLNGCEIGGGSVRIHEPDLQLYILDNILGINTESLNFFIKALKSGAPPHGGIALGFDRYIAMLCRANSIRDVIAFPKTALGKCPMTKAPSSISEEDIKLYNLKSLPNPDTVV